MDYIVKEIAHLKKVTAIVYVLGFLISLPLLAGFLFPFHINYSFVKFIHIFCVITFFGNMMIGPVWAARAFKTKDTGIIYFALRTICRTDVLITIPCLMVTIFTGLLLAQTFGGYMKFSWMIVSLVVLSLSIVPTVPTLKAQYNLYYLSYQQMKGFESSEILFKKNLGAASIWGSVASLPSLAVMILMVVKPAL
jgi:uncharacterized membrane protein